MQTSIIYEPDCSLELCGFEPAPVCPEPDGDAPVYLKQYDGTEIFWMRGEAEGIIRRYEPNGRLTLWYRKPTLADAVAYQGKGGYFKFNAGGSVEAAWYGKNYFWRGDEADNQYMPYGQVEIAHRCGEDGAYRFRSDCPGVVSGCYNCGCSNCRMFSEGDHEYEEEAFLEDDFRTFCHNCHYDTTAMDTEEGFCCSPCRREFYGIKPKRKLKKGRRA